MDSDVLKWVQDRFAEVLGTDAEDVTPSTRFTDDLNADSIDLIEVVNGAEKQFGVTVEEHDLYDLEAVGDLVTLIERLRGR